MSTSAQQLANTANAQKSTGPVTLEGSRRSAMNAYSHGLCAKDILIGPEEQPLFDSLAAKFRFDLAPRGAVELTLCNEIVGAAWQLSRIRRMEAEACADKSTYTEILNDDLLQDKLDRLARHHTRIERTFHRCLKQLSALQAERIKVGKRTSDQLYNRPPAILPDAESSAAEPAAANPISERSQFVPESVTMIVPIQPRAAKAVAEVGRDSDTIKTEFAAQLRKADRRAA